MSLLKDLFKLLNPNYQNAFLDYRVALNPRYDSIKGPHEGLLEIIQTYRKEYEEWLVSSLRYREHLTDISLRKKDIPSSQPYWLNGYFPGLDIILLYTVIAQRKPPKYVEVGSGHSTRVVNKVREDLKLSMEITCIDPQPRAEINSIADRVLQSRLEETDLDIFRSLEAGDVLFIDNSHRILPNSDATTFFLDILPFLKKGVLVHLHDIYLPFDYPQFMCERYYSEQYGLAINILANPMRYKPVLANYYISQDEELSAILNPYWQDPRLDEIERHGGSFWIEIS